MGFLCTDTDLIAHLDEHHPDHDQAAYLEDLDGHALHDRLHVLDGLRSRRDGTYTGHLHTQSFAD